MYEKMSGTEKIEREASLTPEIGNPQTKENLIDNLNDILGEDLTRTYTSRGNIKYQRYSKMYNDSFESTIYDSNKEIDTRNKKIQQYNDRIRENKNNLTEKDIKEIKTLNNNIKELREQIKNDKTSIELPNGTTLTMWECFNSYTTYDLSFHLDVYQKDEGLIQRYRSFTNILYDIQILLEKRDKVISKCISECIIGKCKQIFSQQSNLSRITQRNFDKNEYFMKIILQNPHLIQKFNILLDNPNMFLKHHLGAFIHRCDKLGRDEEGIKEIEHISDEDCKIINKLYQHDIFFPLKNFAQNKDIITNCIKNFSRNIQLDYSLFEYFISNPDKIEKLQTFDFSKFRDETFYNFSVFKASKFGCVYKQTDGSRAGRKAYSTTEFLINRMNDQPEALELYKKVQEGKIAVRD